MAWTKRQLVAEAYAELALAGFYFDLTADELEAGLRRMDSMLGTWTAQGIAIGYTAAASQDASALDQDSGIPQYANEAVYTALAVRIAAGKGKRPADTLRTTAKAAYDALLSTLARDAMQEQQFREGTPAGAGSRLRGISTRPFLTAPDTETLQIGADGGLNFNGA